MNKLLKNAANAVGNAALDVAKRTGSAMKDELQHQWEVEKKSIQKNFVPPFLQEKPKKGKQR